MGKKTKIGKTRKDKFYQLAKESGYRSRAAFKILQLNRTYHFFEKSRICIDLCAAPGGWLQVACTHMPMSSIIIGVDLAPIKPIANVITHIEDITTAKCRQMLKKDLNDSKADIILHDGAPNVGKNWIHDAYQQNMLVLQAFKLASEFLRKGGTFITKIFRSKDYYSLLWVFQQLFKKVDATKPQASRNESAEIFVVCQNFLAPDQIDEKFFDIKFVFSDVSLEAQSKANLLQTLLKPKIGQRHRDGYADNDYTLFHRLNASEFIKSNQFVELLAKSNQIVIDDDRIAKHPASTPEMKQCLQDIKVLGTNDIKNLLKWRLKLKDIYKSEENKVAVEEGEKKVEKRKKGGDESEGSDEDDEEINDEIEKTMDLEKRIEKKKRKKLMKEKRKLRDKIALKMENPEDTKNFDLQNDRELFSLTKIKTKKQLLELQNALPGLELMGNDNIFDEDEEIDIENGLSFKKKTKAKFSKDKEDIDEFYASIEHGTGNGDVPVEVSAEIEDSDNDESGYAEDEDEEENPLVTDLVSGDRKEKKKLLADSWFNKSAFDFLRDKAEDEDDDLLNDLDDGKDDAKETKEATPKRVYHSDSEEDDEEVSAAKKLKKAISGAGGDSDSSDTDSDDDGGDRKEKKEPLTPYQLAIGEMIVNSKEAKSMLIDESYNRFSNFGDPDNLPKWFVDDEKIHNKKDLAVPYDTIKKYEKKSEAINVRPIKKVIEAQARKKRRMSKKLDKARRKAEVIGENAEMSDKERQSMIKAVYKRHGLLGKKKVEVKYVVAKKTAGKRGVMGKQKGPYKVVDKRLKKDKRMNKARDKKGGGKSGKGKKPTNINKPKRKAR